jgi:integrase
MVDADDVQGYARKFDNQRQKLATAPIIEADREAINDWLVHIRASDGSVESLGTVVGHLNRIRLAAERGHRPLVEFESEHDTDRLKLHLKDEYDLSEGTARNYMKAVRKFYQFRGVDWADEVTVGASPDRKHDPDEELTAEEFGAMLDVAAEFDAAARDKAMLALLRDTGLRIGAVLSFQMEHVDFEGDRGTLTINADANVKGADGPKPVTWSRAYVSNWIDIHPRPHIDHAALIHKTRQCAPDEDGALRQQYAGRRIQTIAERAGLDGDRVHAHLFRGTAISEWMRDPEMNDQAIKHRVDWSEDSREFGTYSRVSDEQMNAVIFDAYDIGDGDVEPQGHDLDTCPHCQTSLRGGERYCPACAGALTQSAAERVDDLEDKTFDSATAADASDATSIPDVDLFGEFRRRFESDPDFRARVVDGGDHEDPS